MMKRSILVGLLSMSFMCVVFAETTQSSTMTEANCANIMVQDECCNKTCLFFSCVNKTSTDNVTLTGCHAMDFNASKGPADCKDLSTSICPAVPTVASTTQKTPTIAPTQAPTTADTCKDLNQTDCCAKPDTCKYQSCTKGSNPVEAKCYKIDKDLKDVCDANSQPADACTTPTPAGPTPTSAPVDVCTNYSDDNTTCCTVTDCIFISCNDKVDNTKTHTGCHKKDFTQADFCDGNFTKTCKPATAPTDKPTAGPTKNGTVSSTTESPEAKKNTGGDEGGQKFDGASFIGGIVLCLGIVGIIFISLKVYKAKTERNYQTL